jgi:hypothetical protein
VRHPQYRREERGGTYQRGETVQQFSCGACEREYSYVWRRGEFSVGDKPWCFSGPHTTKPLKSDDERHVYPHSAALFVGPNLQRELDELPADTEQLSVSKGDFVESVTAVLARPLPALRELKIIDVCFSRLVLTPATTPLPVLETLALQNIPDDCDVVVELPRLRSVTWHYWGGPARVLNTMLAAATRLLQFDSYKLRSNEALTFASPFLLGIELHRAEVLRSLTVWAPQLRHLGLQGCYSFEDIQFPASHALAVDLPRGFSCTEPLAVNSDNACLGPAAAAALRAHPRVKKVASKHPANPAEGLFAALGLGGGGGGSAW